MVAEKPSGLPVGPVTGQWERAVQMLMEGDTEGAEDIVYRLLAVFRKYLYPARIPHRHDIGVVSPDAEG